MLGSVGGLNLGLETDRKYSSTSEILPSCQGKIKTHKYFKSSQGLSNTVTEDKKVPEALCALSQERWPMSDASGPRELEGKADLYIQ